MIPSIFEKLPLVAATGPAPILVALGMGEGRPRVADGRVAVAVPVDVVDQVAFGHTAVQVGRGPAVVGAGASTPHTVVVVTPRRDRPATGVAAVEDTVANKTVHDAHAALRVEPSVPDAPAGLGTALRAHGTTATAVRVGRERHRTGVGPPLRPGQGGLRTATQGPPTFLRRTVLAGPVGVVLVRTGPVDGVVHTTCGGGPVIHHVDGVHAETRRVGPTVTPVVGVVHVGPQALSSRGHVDPVALIETVAQGVRRAQAGGLVLVVALLVRDGRARPPLPVAPTDPTRGLRLGHAGRGGADVGVEVEVETGPPAVEVQAVGLAVRSRPSDVGVTRPGLAGRGLAA